MKNCFSCLERFLQNNLFVDDDVYLKKANRPLTKTKNNAIRNFFDDSNIRYEVINTSDNSFSYQATVVDETIKSVQEFESGIAEEVNRIMKKLKLVAQTCVTKEIGHGSYNVSVKIRVN